jgi:N-acetylglucosamine malate deacetylase 1
MKRILAIAVHPDDETLGCGGTLLKHKNAGDTVGCIFVTSGNAQQKELMKVVADRYSFDFTAFLDLPEITIDDMSLSELIPVFSEVVNEFKPSVLYIPNRSDTHSDHKKVFQAVQACIKSFRYPFIKKVLMCEIISETDFAPASLENVFIPNVFVDITRFHDEKMDILNLYKCEMLEDPYTRSFSAVKALQRYRGSQASVQYAEAFMLLKEIC